MDIPPYLLLRFEQQKSQFKATLCQQVDELFQSFLQELKTAAVAAVPGTTSFSSLPPSTSRAPVSSGPPAPAPAQHVQLRSILAIPPANGSANRLANGPVSQESVPPVQVAIKVEPPQTDHQVNVLGQQRLAQEEEEILLEDDDLDNEEAEATFHSDSECDCSDCMGDLASEELIPEPEVTIKTEADTDQEQNLNLEPVQNQHQNSPPPTPTLFTCPILRCGLTFTRQHDLKLHRQQNHRRGRRPQTYQCRVCWKHFANSHKLACHEMIHSGIKPHLCRWPGCTHASTLRFNLITHIRHVHFGLPKTQREQRDAGIDDTRDPNEWIETRWDLIRRAKRGGVPRV